MLRSEFHGVDLCLVDDQFVSDPWVYAPARKGRWYEQKFLEHVRALNVRGVYVDVGGHLGTHTVWFAKLCPSTVVHAIEPVERFAAVLRDNARANGVEGKVRVHEVGVADHDGIATNHLAATHQAGWEGPIDDAMAVDVTFPVRRLDDLVKGRVVVMKLDVEGMEAAALRGATRILSRSHPVVYCEAHDDEQEREIRSVLEPFGYRPTGKVFNASPTYEYAVPDSQPRTAFDRIRRARDRLLP